MNSLLHIEVSPSGARSLSRSVSAEFGKAWLEKHPGGEIVIRDLAANPIPHLDAESIAGIRMSKDEQTFSIANKMAFRKRLIAEILNADDIVISTPIWNWSIPSVLKAYFDQIIMNGTLDISRTRKLAGKKVTFIIAQGSSSAPGTPKEGWDFATSYLKFIATQLGSEDVEIIKIEYGLAGIAPGLEAFTDHRAASLAAAKEAARIRAA